MAYSFQTVQLGGAGASNIITSATNLGLPATYTCALFSAWIAQSTAGSFNFADQRGTVTGPVIMAGFTVTFMPLNYPPQVFWSATNADGSFIGSGWNVFPASPPTSMLHLLVSVDTTTQQAQLYVNDVACPLSGSDPTVWHSINPMARAPTVAAYQLAGGAGCIGDIWFTDQTTFTDLSITANRRKFINADLSPVDPGINGQIPFGAVPRVFLHCGLTDPGSVFTVNNGTGGTFSPALPIGSCLAHGGGAAETLIDAELYFNPTAGFVDFSNSNNRRQFVSTGNGAQYLGLDGSRPLGASPAVYLTAQLGQPLSFATNNGVGGAFAITGSIDPFSPAPGCTPYVVTEAAGPAANPEWRLTVSDDGGRTWSTLVKPRSIGALGQYLTRLRWMKLGHSRERMVRLECSDPVRRNVVGFYIDTTQGMG